MPTTLTTVAETPLIQFVLQQADDGLILGHRLSEWTGRAPMLEEELAIPNIALDLIGQARALYTYAGELEAAGHDEDDFAYHRDAHQFRNLLLVEQPNGDFAQTIVRQFLYSAFADLYWRAMMRSTDTTLAAIAAKSEKETAYHLRHASEWVIRLGDGTDESHARAQAAVELLYPFTGELFEALPDFDLRATGVALDPAPLRPDWDATLDRVFAEATLRQPKQSWMQRGGRAGRHTEHLGRLLAEMQSLPRTYPGASW